MLTTLSEIKQTCRQWHFWVLLAWQDIQLRYRRSTLGPLWITLSMSVTILLLGILYAKLFHQPIDVFLPYLASGLIAWGFISTVITEGCQTFIESEYLLKQIKIPLIVFCLRVSLRNSIIFLHNLLAFIGVIIFFKIVPDWNYLLLFPGLLLMILTSVPIILMVGMFCARFRDIPPVIGSIVQLLFFMTPIIWQADLLPHSHYIIRFNPVYYFVELIRKPLLGQAPSLSSWIVCTMTFFILTVLSLILLKYYRARVVYWL